MKKATCGVCADPDRRALRFSLMRSIAGRHTTRGCGGIDLCEPCWRELTRGSRQRPGSLPK